jgi:hypothetical protein
MGEYKPLGSERLQGDDKLKRILELTYYKTNSNKTKSSTEKAELVKESTAGVYGIVREKDGYYVKKGLNESSLDYIGGMFMKNKNRFSSYAEALKRLELLKGQEQLQEATKYVLKPTTGGDTPPPSPEGGDMGTPPPPPAPEGGDMGGMPPSPEGDMGLPAPEGGDMGTPEGGDMGGMPPAPEGDMESPEGGDMGDESGKPSDYMAEVQKFAGKLGQELRDQKSKMESDDIKYVLNMVISAVDLEKLSEEDLEEIGKKFEPKEEGEEGSEGGEETPPSGEESPEMSDTELGEIINKLNKFVKTKAPQETDEIDLSKYADIGNEKEEVSEIDMDKIKKEINDSISGTLSKYFK